MSQIILRPDQLHCKHGAYEAWNDGAQVVLIRKPTGAGKSVVMSDMSVDIDSMGLSHIITAHRNELVGQMANHVAARGIKHRIIAPKAIVAKISEKQRKKYGRSFVNPDARCAVGGIDTINSRATELAPFLRNVAYFFGDEGHHYLRGNKWGNFIDMIPQARGLLVTACTTRADGRGLGRHADGYVDVMIDGLSVRQTINIGAITDYEIAIPESDFDIDDADISGVTGDWSHQKMRAASKKSHIVGDVVAEYAKRAWGKRAICFATDVETATEIAARFNAAGIPAMSVSGKTPQEVRDDAIERFEQGRIWILVNVDLFDEGFDVPACEVVILARPTASLNKYLQMCGRALRTAPGKLYGLIIDHVSNWKRHGLPDKHHVYTLDRREKRSKKEPDPEDIPLTACKGCSRPYERFHAVCPYCGFAPPLPEPGSRTLQQVDGDLTLLTVEMLAAMRAETELESPASMAQRVAAVAGDFAGRGAAAKLLEKHAAQERLSTAIAQWAAIQRAKGRPDSESYRRLYLTLGVDVLGALHRDRTRADYEATAEIVEGWCNVV